MLAATPPCGASTVPTRVTARFQLDGAFISNGNWSKEIRVSSPSDECVTRIEIVSDALISAVNGSINIGVNALGANGNVLDDLPQGASVVWSAERGVVVVEDEATIYVAPSEIGEGTDTLNVAVSFADTTLSDSATIAITPAIAKVTFAGVEMISANEYALRMIVDNSVSFNLSLISNDGSDVTELVDNGDVESVWTLPIDSGSIEDLGSGHIRYTAPSQPGTFELALSISQRSSMFSEDLIFKILVREPPTFTAIDIVDSAYLSDSKLGTWEVILSNSSDEAKSFSVQATTSIGVTASETSEQCTSAEGAWSCEVPANDYLDIVFTAPLNHMCQGSAALTVDVVVSGEPPFTGSDTRTVRGTTLNCPSITLSDAEYDEQSQAATWVVTVEDRKSVV